MKQGRRILVLSLIAAFTATMVWCAVTSKRQRRLAEGMVRLRVVAASDTPEAQTAKLLVRDAVLASAEGILDGAEDRDEAALRLSRRLGELETAANDALIRAGRPERASVCLTSERAGTRRYGTFTLPAGPYLTLRVDLGAAEGQNWWCVVFPPLCREGALEETVPAALTEEELEWIRGGEEEYVLRFRTLEILEELWRLLNGKPA